MDSRLDQARQLLESGQVEKARTLASRVLKEAEENADRAQQGQALIVLAQFDRVLGRFRRAVEAAQKAVHLFQMDGNIAGEASALSLVAHASNYLGRDEEAVEAALLSVKLGDLLPPGRLQVNLYNYVGVAYLWANNFDGAQAALRTAECLANRHAPGDSVLLPRINLAWLEALRIFKQRYFTGALPDTAELAQRLARCDELFANDTPFEGLPGVRAVLQRFGRCAKALLHCWRDELDLAQAQLALAQDLTRPGNYAPVASYFSHWVAAEIALRQDDLSAAQSQASQLLDKAAEAEYEQMAYVAHLLLTLIYKMQGNLAAALDEECAHRRRQLRVHTETLETRHRIVQTQLDMRKSEDHLQQLVKHSQELERLSFEDSLTGIANRRRFELELSGLLGAHAHGQRHVCVALLDLDDFKRVNDRYSHAAGDQVLVSFAQAMRATVRETDLPARLGGDEFVVLFPGTPLDMAREVCDRLHAAISGLRWDGIAPELQVGDSIGLVQANPGETPEQVLARSDAAMFQTKDRSKSEVRG
jgi:diguanylate cyclase (GGDEF)-like protein